MEGIYGGGYRLRLVQSNRENALTQQLQTPKDTIVTPFFEGGLCEIVI